MDKLILDRLRNDKDYYGEYGKQFLSASGVRTLIKEPHLFGKSFKTLPLLEGRYFHLLMLEEDKVDDIPIVEMKSRNSNAFKEFKNSKELDSYDILLQHEADKMQRLADKMRGNIEFFDYIYSKDNQFEVPGLEKIHGQIFKGKCDVLSENYVYDIKTTGNQFKFRWSADEYLYHAQAYIYQMLFKKPMVFLIIDKNTGLMRYADCSDRFIEKGELSVIKAINIYEKFYSPKATDNIDSFVFRETL